MFKFLRCIPSVVTTTRHYNSGISASSRSNGVFNNISAWSSNFNILKTSGVDFIQTRGKHVKDDAMEPHRVLRHDRKTGKRTQADIVLKIFYRLHWGGWIRTMCGRNRRLHKRDSNRMRKLRKHVLCNAQQSKLLDRLTLDDVKRRHYYPDDPYEPYHSREEYLYTRTKPLPPSKDVEKYLDS